MWNNVTEFKPYVAAHEAALKKLFAAAWLRRPDDPQAAAFEVEPEHAGRAIWIKQNWCNDPDVLAERQRLFDLNPVTMRVPSAEDLALEVYKLANDKTISKTTGDKLAAYKFFAELMKYTERPGSGVNVQINNGITAKIMPVPLAADDATWERVATAHQEVLQLQHERRS
jgi:hypothetical protein